MGGVAAAAPGAPHLASEMWEGDKLNSVRVPRPNLLGREGAYRYPGLYIRPRKPFVISAYLYIQNRNPCLINKTLGIPQGVYSTPPNQVFPIPPFVYTSSQPLCHQHKFVYTEPQPICYQRIVGFYIGNGVQGTKPPETQKQTRPGRSSPNQPQPAPSRAQAPRASSQPSRKIYLCHAS